MISKIIAVCGAPYTGKSTIMDALRKHTVSPDLICKADEFEPNIRLNVTYSAINLHFVTRSGAFLRPESMIPKVLMDASMVVYVLEPCLPNGESVNFTHDFYQNYFEYYTQYAQKLGVFWTDVPWIIVLNKVDLASELPPGASLFPETLVAEITRCVATQHVGIPELWSKLVRKAAQT